MSDYKHTTDLNKFEEAVVYTIKNKGIHDIITYCPTNYSLLINDEKVADFKAGHNCYRFNNSEGLESIVTISANNKEEK